MQGVVTRSKNRKGAGVTPWKTTALQDFMREKESAKERRRRWEGNLERAASKSPAETARKGIVSIKSILRPSGKISEKRALDLTI